MPSDPNNPEILTSVRTDVEAAAIVGALAARSIGVSTTGSYTAGFRAEAPGCVNVIAKYKDLLHLPEIVLAGRKEPRSDERQAVVVGNKYEVAQLI